MRPTLANYLNIIIPDLGTEIATPEAKSKLQKLADFLPPILRGGFECRLSTGMTQVDLQQCIFIKNKEPKFLIEYINDLALLDTESDCWKNIQNFCQVLSDDNSVLYKGINDIWLEFDIDDFQCLTPSIFFNFNCHINDVFELVKIAESALELLLNKPIIEPLKANLSGCFTNCTLPTRVSHIGVMLSRQQKALRVNIDNLPPDHISTYLQNIGFTGVTEEIEVLSKELLYFVENVRICLDVGNVIYPHVGLECFFSEKTKLVSSESNFLNYLVEQGLCSSVKRDALLAWSGYTTPKSSLHPWSSNLIAESLLKPANQFSIFERKVSHIKIVNKPSYQLEAKAYLWFQHKWLPVAEN
ncbi:hypothetical protein [Nostoc sp.]|uniref:hypothetical protein n=1 Tax=Nostoc sp. TaxID=1180 RepID=UPI002FF556A3